MKRHKKIMALGGVTVVLIAAGATLLHFMDMPMSATNISTGHAAVAPESSDSMGKTAAVTGAYAAFSYYSSLFKSERTLPISGNIVATYGYEHQSDTPWQLTITVNFLPNGNMRDDSAYYDMMQNPDRYSSSSETVNGNMATIMSDTTVAGYDKTAFLFHGSYSADISLSSDDVQDTTQQQAVLTGVLQSWQWK